MGENGSKSFLFKSTVRSIGSLPPPHPPRYPFGKEYGYDSDSSTEKDVSGEIKASSNKITRRLPYRITYKRDQQQLEIGSTSLVAQGYEDAKMKLIANGDGLRLEFGRKGKPQYSVTVSGQIENQGKSLKVQANWTEVPSLFSQICQCLVPTYC